MFIFARHEAWQDVLLDPWSTEDSDQRGKVLQGCVSDGEDGVFDEADADRVDLLYVEILAELLGQQRELFNDRLFRAPVLVRAQLHQTRNN